MRLAGEGYRHVDGRHGRDRRADARSRAGAASPPARDGARRVATRWARLARVPRAPCGLRRARGVAARGPHLPRLSAERLRDMVRFADEEWWREATSWERSTGVLVLSGHFGNWELLVFAHGMRGHPVHMVHRTIANPLLDRWLNALRARAGTRTIRKRHAARAVLAALHERGLLVLPFDQNSTRGLGVFVDFFGVPASTNAGLARIALRTDAPIVPAFIVREGRSARHRVHVLPIMQVERTGDPRADVVRNTQRFSAVFEDMVRRHPEQWLWMHKRWKTRPPGAPRLY
ncbi:MAG: lysophospholipid acyltransferase family protein [Deltaproteobacteria bacterium]|nr:MAG: lysophospholipid acyltransferase family protein [Deltaproteobacteria bacterium]